MCTVSYIPNINGAIITHNRDEKSIRSIALPPIENGNNIYPVDTLANGTWFIINKVGDVGALLNGANEKHISLAPYKCSRGLILPMIFDSKNPLQSLQKLDLHNIEPFTIIMYIKQKLYECKWNAFDLSIQNLDALKSYIWSSVTLYNKEMIAAREKWFIDFLESNNTPTQNDIIHFHSNTTNKNYGLQINRNNAMLTVSITSVAINESTAQLYYKDCIHNIVACNNYILTSRKIFLLV